MSSCYFACTQEVRIRWFHCILYSWGVVLDCNNRILNAMLSREVTFQILYSHNVFQTFLDQVLDWHGRILNVQRHPLCCRVAKRPGRRQPLLPLVPAVPETARLPSSGYGHFRKYDRFRSLVRHSRVVHLVMRGAHTVEVT